MKRSLFMVLVGLFILAAGAPADYAQARGAGGGGASDEPALERDMDHDMDRDMVGDLGSSDRERIHEKEGDMLRTRQQERVRETKRMQEQKMATQRAQVRACTSATLGIKSTVGKMAMDASGESFSVKEARQTQMRISSQFKRMIAEHERLMNSLDKEQKTAQQERIRLMNEIHARIEAHVNAMDKELATDSPDAKVVAKQAREMEREMQQLMYQYRQMKSELEDE